MENMKYCENTNVVRRRNKHRYARVSCCFTWWHRWFYILSEVLNNQVGQAKWNPYYYRLKILLNCLELAKPFLTQCTRQAGLDHCQLSLAVAFCGIVKSLRPGWGLAVRPDSNGKIERQRKMKIFVDTIRISVQNASMEPVVTILSDNLRFMARAYLSVRTVTLQLLGVINPWPSFMRS